MRIQIAECVIFRMGLALCLLVLSACGGGGGASTGASTGIVVPNVVGDTQTSATTAITGAGLVVGTVAQQSSSTVASGSVISESPAAGTDVATGSAVNLVVSSGNGQVAVPNVVGDTQTSATTAITGAGLVVGTVSQQSSSTAASGSVISESPAAGTNVASGSAVNLVVSSGSAQVAVPNVVGDTQTSATTAIAGAGLVVGTVTQQSSSTAASGSVISESPAAGTNVASGSAVALVVSSGSASGGGYTVGGMINGGGLAFSQVSGLVLSDGIATTSPIFVAASGFNTAMYTFTFSPLPSGTAYAVSVATQPPGVTCVVIQGATGTIGMSNVTNVSITCGEGTWTSLSPMPTPRLGSAVAVVNNVLYVIGGISQLSNFACYDNVESYDPSTGAWTEETPYPFAGWLMAAVGIGNSIYVFGGSDCTDHASSAVWSYNTATKVWNQVSTPLPSGGLAGMGAATDGTSAYLVGGISVSSSGTTCNSNIQVFNPSTGWTSTAQLAGIGNVDCSGLGQPGVAWLGPIINGGPGSLEIIDGTAEYTYLPGSPLVGKGTPVSAGGASIASNGSIVLGLAQQSAGTYPLILYCLAGQGCGAAPFDYLNLAPLNVNPGQALPSAAFVNGSYYVVGGFEAGSNNATGALEVYQP